MNIEKFISEIFNKVDTQLAEQDIISAKRSMTDSLAALAAGFCQSKSLLEDLYSEGQGQGADVGLSGITCITLKSLIVGTASHYAELDDGVISGIIHPGSPILSAILCHAPNKIESAQLYRAIVIGYEVCTLLAEVIQPNHKKLGYHATATCGVFGAIAALSVINNNDIDFCVKALNISANYSQGTLSALKGGSNLKSVNVGFATQVAISSYMLAKAGFHASEDAFCGKFGFFDRFCTISSNLDEVFGSENLAINRVYNKPYASCRYCHPAIECTLNILQINQFSLDEIESIEIETYGLAIDNHDHINIAHSSSAKMSIPYSVVTALMHHKAGLQEYETNTITQVIQSGLMAKVFVKERKDYSDLFPECESASVKIVLNSGDSFCSSIEHASGSQEKPMNNVAIRNKLIDCFNFSSLPLAADHVLAMIWDGEVIDVKSILDLFTLTKVKK